MEFEMDKVIKFEEDHEPRIIFEAKQLTPLIKSNLSCHNNKPLTQELIEALTTQITESIDYFLNKREE
jgi:hypothetical protein